MLMREGRIVIGVVVKGWILPPEFLIPVLKERNKMEKPKLIFTSFGIKNGQEWPQVDCYVDCRGVPNPLYGGPSGTGHDPKVREWVREELGRGLPIYVELIQDGLRMLPTRRGVGHEADKPFIICCLCAHGIHRSVSMKHILATYFSPSYVTEVQ